MNPNIEKMIIATQEYEKESLTNPALDFQIILEQHGYNNPEEYFNDKFRYNLKNNNFSDYSNVSAKELEVLIPQVLQNSTPALLKLNTQNLCITEGAISNTIKETVLLNYPEIEYLHSPCKGGAIILGPEDIFIFISIINIDTQRFKRYIMESLRAYLAQYSEDVIIKDNDILINNKKVIGAVFDGTNAQSYGAFFISFCDRSALIKDLIDKNGKEPGFINPKFLSKEKMEEEILSWLV